MVSILHISDLHLTQNPNWNMMKRSILSYAESMFRDIPDCKKLLIITGDFHNYMQDSYEPAKEFLDNLIKRMGIEPTEDVFVVPGNHDVSASSGDYDRSLVIRALKEQESYRNALNQECDFRKYAMPKLLSCYDGYLQFVRDMGIYSVSDKLWPVEVHVRTWRNRLHIMHLNTTLIADGATKTNQLADALTATSDKVQNALLRDNLPCIAIGHNSYMDLDERLQTEALRNAFYYGNISAYLCGDRHETTQEPRDRFIYLKRDGSLPIDNIVAPRGSADQSDNYSEFGMILHQWDERTGTVTYTSYFWKPNDPEVHPGDSLPYTFRNNQTPKSSVRLSPNMGSVSALEQAIHPVRGRDSVAKSDSAPSADTPPDVESASASVTPPAPVTPSAPKTASAPSAGKLSPQDQFLTDIQSLYDKYGFHASIGRVCYVGKRLMDTLNEPNATISAKSRAMVDCQNLLRKTITDMENDLEDLHPDKSDRIAKLEKALADLKDL